MSIGLVGAHRVGKSTLAEAYSQETDMPLLLTSIGKVFESLGLDPAGDLTVSQRLTVQEMILDEAEKLWAGETEAFICDRTPVDMLAYTLSDLYSSDNLRQEDEERLSRYRQRCIDLTNRYFSLLVLIQPGIPMIEAPMKGKFTKAAQMALNYSMKGILADRALTMNRACISENVLLLDERVKRLSDLHWNLVGLSELETAQVATLH